MKKLLSKTNAKLIKGEKLGYLTFGLSLAPAKLSGKNLCPSASAGCIAACLNTAGMGKFDNVQTARINKAKAFVEDSKSFTARLEFEIAGLASKANKQGKKLAIRLNVVSDIAWEKYGIIEKFPAIQFYDYTKNPFRALQFNQGKLPSNYHLTFSRSETNETAAKDILKAGGNVAVVFSGKTLPETWDGYSVINGDDTDLRFLDEKNVVVGLLAKGKAKKDQSGFVVPFKKKKQTN